MSMLMALEMSRVVYYYSQRLRASWLTCVHIQICMHACTHAGHTYMKRQPRHLIICGRRSDFICSCYLMTSLVIRVIMNTHSMKFHFFLKLYMYISCIPSIVEYICDQVAHIIITMLLHIAVHTKLHTKLSITINNNYYKHWSISACNKDLCWN